MDRFVDAGHYIYHTFDEPIAADDIPSSHILSAVQAWRGTAVWPGRTGPVSDMLYSAAGAVENRYDPLRGGTNYRKKTVTVN